MCPLLFKTLRNLKMMSFSRSPFINSTGSYGASVIDAVLGPTLGLTMEIAAGG